MNIFDIFNFGKNRQHNLLNHSLFSTLSYCADVQTPTFNISSKSKKTLICFFMQTVKTVYTKNISSKLEDPSFDIGTAPNFFIDINIQINTELKQQGVPEIFIERMNVWNRDNNDATHSALESIVNSEFYSSSYDEWLAVLNIFTFYIQILAVSMEKTMDSFNGDLESALMGTRFDNN
ncbi:MAG: hypothetical protein PHF63_00075 [Herbinix sp.]|nr:hypothetical protein [Herbinix sp.]